MTTPESIRDTDRARLPGHWRAGIQRIIETQVEISGSNPAWARSLVA
jgi:hypothetical protein